MLTHLEKDWIQSHIFKLLKVIGYTIKLNVRFRDWKLSTWTFSKILSFILNKGTLTFPWQPLQFNTVQSLSHAQLLVNAWTTAWQASLSITNSRSLLKLMYIKSVMPSNHLIQHWLPLGLTWWISLQSKGLARVFSNSTVVKHSSALSVLYGSTLTSIHDYWKNHSFD